MHKNDVPESEDSVENSPINCYGQCKIIVTHNVNKYKSYNPHPIQENFAYMNRHTTKFFCAPTADWFYCMFALENEACIDTSGAMTDDVT